MALNKTVLTNLIKSKLVALGRDASKIDEQGLGAIAEAIVEHIQTAAVVNTTVTVVNVSGVTPGPGVSGPGTGTGVGTVL